MASSILKILKRNTVTCKLLRAKTQWGKQKQARYLSSQLPEDNFSKNSKRPEIGQSETLMDIGTRKIFSEEHDLFRENVRRFFREEILPHQDRWEKQRYVDREIWEKMGAAGFLGVSIPEEQGGIGGDFKSSMILVEEQGYANMAGSGWMLHSDMVMPYIAEYGTKEQVEKFIPAMTAGTNITAIAMTEPDAGSDLQGVKTYAKKDGDDWILNGSKVFITNGYLANTVVVVAVTELSAKSKAHGISLFLVEDDMPGFNKGRILEKIGQKASDTAELFFEDVRLPPSALLGGEEMRDRGFYILMSLLPRERLVLATACQAHAEYMFEITRDYIRKRKAFGNTLSNLQTIQHRMAEMKTQICLGRSFLDNCIELLEGGRLDSSTASMCKYWLSDMNNKVANECVQLHGGWGYMWEYPIARAYASARVFPIYAGSNEIMKELIARDIVKERK